MELSKEKIEIIKTALDTIINTLKLPENGYLRIVDNSFQSYYHPKPNGLHMQIQFSDSFLKERNK